VKLTPAKLRFFEIRKNFSFPFLFFKRSLEMIIFGHFLVISSLSSIGGRVFRDTHREAFFLKKQVLFLNRNAIVWSSQKKLRAETKAPPSKFDVYSP